jgi:hypothetical protein
VLKPRNPISGEVVAQHAAPAIVADAHGAAAAAFPPGSVNCINNAPARRAGGGKSDDFAPP